LKNQDVEPSLSKVIAPPHLANPLVSPRVETAAWKFVLMVVMLTPSNVEKLPAPLCVGAGKAILPTLPTASGPGKAAAPT
jgi:hypothetical protein